MAYIQLEELYETAINDLIPELEPSDRIAAGDIGVIGYFSQAPILDLVGLISPGTSKYFPIPSDQYVINYAVPTDLILDSQPDYLIILEVYGRRTILLDSIFQDTYSLIQEYPTDIYGSQAMLVFERR
jgi:hypothetical protein